MAETRGSSREETTGQNAPAQRGADRARPADRGTPPEGSDRSPAEQAEIDRKAGDVADDLADFA